MELPLPEQIRAFTLCLERRGLLAALEMLNDRTDFRYTVLHLFGLGSMRLYRVFDRQREHRSYVWRTPLLHDFCRLTRERGEYLLCDAHRDGWRDGLPRDGLVASYCGITLRDGAGVPLAILSHFDLEARQMRPMELSFLRTVAPLLLEELEQMESVEQNEPNEQAARTVRPDHRQQRQQR